MPEDSAGISKGKKLWYFSLGALAAANALDASSSWGKWEADGMLASSRGTFGYRAVGMKTGIVAGVMVAQLLLCRKVSKGRFYRIMAGSNFAAAGAITAVAARNYTIRAPAINPVPGGE